KEFGKNSNLSHLLLFFDLLVDWRLIGVDDYPKITEENLEKYWDLQIKCTVPEALTEVIGLSIDPALVNATPYWVYLAAGKKEQQALIDYIRNTDVPMKKKTEWTQFLQVTWKKYPLKYVKKGSSATLVPIMPVKAYSLTKMEAATFAEIDKMITADMQDVVEQQNGVRWAQPQHTDFITIAMNNEKIPDILIGLANQSAPLPDGWYPWDPTGMLARSMNHGYLITQYAPTVEGLGLAPQNTGAYAFSAKTKFLMHNYNDAFTDLGYSSHFITDLGQPYHTPNLILGMWPSYDDPFSTESKIVKYKALHDAYEGFVDSYWITKLPNGKSFSDYANSATGATIVIDPTTSAKYHAVSSNIASVPLYYLCNWHYIIYRKYDFQNNPAIIGITGERMVATTQNTRGLVRFVTGEQAPMLTITASAGEHGSIRPSGSVTANYQSTPTFTISPDSGFVVEDVKVDSDSKGAVTSFTFDPVTIDRTITATFKQIPTASIVNGGFEEGLYGWDNTNWGYDTPCAHSGVISAAYRGLGGGNLLSQNIDTTGASSIRFWYSRHSFTNGDLIVYLDSVEKLRITGTGSGSPDWYEAEIPVPSSGTHKLDFYVAGYSYWTNLDDVQLIGPGINTMNTIKTNPDTLKKEGVPAVELTPWQWDFRNETTASITIP
ncbi:MAG: hypothetical protein Q8R70_08780, partial [Methanoregula sp.]|nr:hypothetical protein [Methanoregula sp.]